MFNTLMRMPHSQLRNIYKANFLLEKKVEGGVHDEKRRMAKEINTLARMGIPVKNLDGHWFKAA